LGIECPSGYYAVEKIIPTEDYETIEITGNISRCRIQDPGQKIRNPKHEINSNDQTAKVPNNPFQTLHPKGTSSG
jgi:hypothetical protein